MAVGFMLQGNASTMREVCEKHKPRFVCKSGIMLIISDIRCPHFAGIALVCFSWILSYGVQSCPHGVLEHGVLESCRDDAPQWPQCCPGLVFSHSLGSCPYVIKRWGQLSCVKARPWLFAEVMKIPDGSFKQNQHCWASRSNQRWHSLWTKERFDMWQNAWYIGGDIGTCASPHQVGCCRWMCRRLFQPCFQLTMTVFDWFRLTTQWPETVYCFSGKEFQIYTFSGLQLGLVVI